MVLIDRGAAGQRETPASLDGGYGWVIVLASFVCNMIVDGIPTSFGIFIESLVTSFHQDAGTVTHALSVNVGTHLLVGPLVGALCKKYSCRAVCIAGSILSTAAFLLSMFARDTLVFTLLYGLLGGTGFGMIYISTVILVSYYFELRRSLAVSISVCGSGFGLFVFPPLSTYLLHKFAWQGTHLIFAGLTFSCIGFSLLLVPVEYFLAKTTETDVTPRIHERSRIRPSISQPRRSQVSYNAALCSVYEDRQSEEERSEKEESSNNFQKDPDNHHLSTTCVRQKSEEGDLNQTSIDLEVPLNAITKTTHLMNWESPDHVIPETYAITSAQQLRRREILKILLFTRIVLKKDISSGSKLPVFSRRILNAMKSLREMSGDSENLEYEVLDFYEIKKSKSEDLTLLQHYFSRVDFNLGESLPSDLNHYAYIVNEVGRPMSELKEAGRSCDAGSQMDASYKANTSTEKPPDVVSLHSEEDKDPAAIAVCTRNVKSLPVLDQLSEHPSEASSLRETQSNRTLALGEVKNSEEHVRFIRNLFGTHATPRNFWTDDEMETTNSEYSFPSESAMKEKIVCVANGSIEVEPVTSEDCAVEMKKKDNGDSAWWHSSSSVRKDMFYTGSICTLKEFQDEADQEAYRARNTVQVSLLQEMWDKDLLSNPVFIMYILSNVFILAGYYIPYMFLVNTAISRGIDPTSASYLMSAVGLSNMVGRIFFGFLDSWKLVDSLVLNNLSLLVSGLAILRLAYCSLFYDYVFTSVVLGFSQACVVCVTTTLLVEHFSLDKLTSSFGLLQMFRGLAIIVGAPCGGLVFKWKQDYLYTYWVSAGFYAVAVGFGCLMHVAVRTDRREYHLVASRQGSQGCHGDNRDQDHRNLLNIRYTKT